MIAICQLILWELLLPIIVGMLFLNVNKFDQKLPFLWISGQFLLWALFQGMCVPFILLKIDFFIFVWFYAAAVGFLVLLALAVNGRRIKNTLKNGKNGAVNKRINSATMTKVCWGIFAVLFIFQMIQAVCMTYADGDDAYYVAVTTITNDAETMYRKLPYTGGATELDVRHGLAPFPIWISLLAKVSGIKPVAVAHIAVPLMLIAMTYGIFYLLGEKLFAKNKSRIPLFLIFTEILVLFGDYSYYTAENFMIARSRQGKAALGSIVIPMMFLLLFMLLQYWQENKKLAFSYWVLLTSAMMTGCLCSTMGALLCCMLVGITGLCGVATYRKWKYLVPLGLCCSPCVAYALIYLMQN